MSTHVVELRCDHPPLPWMKNGRLFAKLLVEGDPHIDRSTNLVEVVCKDCSAANGARTLHRFNIAGSLVETSIEH